MVIDRERVKQAFQEYTGRYDIHDEKIRLKVEHTYRVADISEQIADILDEILAVHGEKDNGKRREKVLSILQKVGLSEEDIALAWLIGMLHDIGRFEQLRRFHTFVDSQSIDHAHFGVELLFQDGLLARFVDNSGENEELIKKAIYWHSAFRIDPQLNDREMLFAKVIRDADKIDILKVATDFPLEEIYNVATEQIHAHLITEEVMQQFRQKQAIFRDTKKVPIDNLVGHIALVFELEFPQSYEIVKEQGYLDRLLAFQSPNEGLMLQFQEMRQIMQEHLQAMAEKNRQTV